MNDIVEIGLIVVAAVSATTLVYKLLSFRSLAEKKPRFTLFPKYLVKYDQPLADIQAALEGLEFKRETPGVYVRGKVYGDFSAKAIKLVVRVDEGAGEFTIAAAFFGILFDTGDVWQVAMDILDA